MGIFKNCFSKSKHVDNHFRFITDTIVLKRVILHNGNTCLIKHGMPSGHAWTSHINSLCNWIIWTSTMMYCPYVPHNIGEDYALQIMGDDVALHTKVRISKEKRNQIVKWMVREFNYKAVDSTVDEDKRKDNPIDDRPIFLRRTLDHKGMLDTKIVDIWEKIIFGAEASGLRFNRTAYILRRINDLAIYNKINTLRLAIYAAFVECIESTREIHTSKLLRDIFQTTRCFTLTKQEIWKIFYKVTGIKPSEIYARIKYYYNYIRVIYTRNYLVYETKKPYVETWLETRRTVSVTQYLRNFDNFAIFFSTDIFQILHGKAKKGKRKNVVKKRLAKRGKNKLS
jgi:hypothetical protein